MEDYNKVLDATEVAENANGVAAEKMTVYNESLAAAQNRLTASIQQFAQDSNLDQILALAYDGLSKVVEILNILLNKIPILSPLIKAMGVALATAFAGATIKNMVSTSDVLSSIVKAAPGVVSALSQMASGAAGFSAVVKAAGGPLTIILSALSAIIAIAPAVASAFNNMFPSAEQKIKNVNEAFESAQQEADTTQQKLDEINSKIKEIDAKGTLTLADKNEKQKLEEQRDVLKDILQYQKDIASEKLRELKEEYGKQYTEKYSSKGIDTSEQYSYITAGTDPYASEYSTQIGPYIEYYDTENASIEQLMANLQKLGEERRNLNKEDKNYGQSLNENNQLTQENITALKQKAIAIGEDIQKMKELGLTNTDYYKNAVAQYSQIKSYTDPSNFEKIQLSDLIDIKGIEEKLQEAIQTGDDAGKQTAENYANQFAQEILNPRTDASIKESWAKAMDINIDDLNVDSLTQEILARLQQMFGDISDASTSAAQSFISQSDALESYQNEIVKIHDSTTDLTAAYQDMIDKGYLSETVVKKLIEAHPELTKQLKLENGQYKINIETLKEANDAAYNESIATIKSQKEETQVVIDSTWERIRAVNREVRALKAKAMVTGEETDFTKYVNAERELGDLMTNVQEYSKAIEAADVKIVQLEKDRDTWAPTSTKTSSKSAANQAAKEFENSIKEKIKNLKGVVTTYSTDGFGAWDSQEAINKATTKYNKFLSEIVDNPEARKIAAEQLGVSIEDESTEDQIRIVTNALKEQAGTIEEARQKLQDNYLKGLKTAADAEKKLYDDAKKQIEELNKLTQNMIETGVDLLEKAGDFVFSLLDNVSDKYDKQIDNLDKIMNDLDNQKDAFDDKIDAQKEYLKLQKEEMDNQKELAEKTQSIADIDARLAEMQYDDSAAAQAERLKLLDERAQKEKELKDLQDETAYDDKINALDAQKKQFDTTIEAQKKALEEQKQALEDSQNKFENTVNKVKSAFDGFIKMLDSTVFKNLATNLLNSIDGDTLKSALYSWNKIFGTGIDADVTTGLDAYNTLKKYGWVPGQNIQDYTNMFAQGSYVQEQILGQIEQASAANTAGQLDLSQYVETINTLNKSWDTFKQNATAGITQIGENTQSTIQNVWSFGQKMIDQEASASDGVVNTVAKGIKTTLKNGKNGISSLLNIGVQANQTLGLNGQEIITQIGDTARNVLALVGVSGGGIVNTVIQAGGSLLGKIGNLALNLVGGISTVGSNAISTLANVGLQALSSISGVSTALFGSSGQLYTGSNSLNTGVTNALDNASKNLAQLGINLGLKIGGTGGLIAAAAGVAAGGVTATVSNVSKLWKSNQSFGTKFLGTLANLTPVGILINLFTRHHSGADYVKKNNPALDKMLGLGNDETVSILKVGEAVVPTWANNANSSASGSVYTGDSATRAVAAAKQGTRLSSSAAEHSSVVNTISMPINIQGNADESTVKLLKEQSEQIAKTVFKLINKQTNMSGYRNIRAATI